MSDNYPESKAEFQWEAGGLQYSVVWHDSLGHYCGYVRFPKKLVKENGYNGILTYVPVHGGITFAEQQAEGMVYGFDCGHAGDGTNPDTKNIDWIKSQCELMGRAITAAKHYERRYLRCVSNKGKAKVLDEFHDDIGARPGSDNFGVNINLLSGQL